jgi:hypothetical protein
VPHGITIVEIAVRDNDSRVGARARELEIELGNSSWR